MHTLFLDANIFFAAAASSTGGSRAIFELARHRKIRLVSSIYAVNEAKINLEKKMHEKELIDFYTLLSDLDEIGSETCLKQDTEKYEHLIVKKDLPILVAAHLQKADFLITLDRKDFHTEKLRHAHLPYEILLPGDYLKRFL